MNKKRLDLLLVERGLAPSREKAQALIIAGRVKVNGQIITKAGTPVNPDLILTIDQPFPYVSRAGAKLVRALEVFPIQVKGVTALDIGSSTGGFTDCLLQVGARKVYAVDVNIKQLDWKVAHDPRVQAIEKMPVILSHQTCLKFPSWWLWTFLLSPFLKYCQPYRRSSKREI